MWSANALDFSSQIAIRRNPNRNEHGCERGLRSTVAKLIRKYNDSEKPSWIIPLMQSAKFCYHGGKKEVYVYRNTAIAISDRPIGLSLFWLKLFKQINRMFPNTLNYPSETYEVSGYLKDEKGDSKHHSYFVALLPKCSFTLIDTLIDGYHGFEASFIPLGRALRELHNKNVVLGDIKPDNILICGKSLSFGDIDEAYRLEKHNTIYRFTAPYNLFQYWKEYKKVPVLTDDHYKFLDWYAFAYCVLVSCSADGYGEQIVRAAYGCTNAKTPFRMKLMENEFKNASIHPIVRQCVNWMLLSNGDYIDPKPMADFFTQRRLVIKGYKW